MSLASYQRTAVDTAGNILPSAHVEVRSEVPGQPLAVIYSDRAGASPIANPMAVDANGYFIFFVAGGSYQVKVYTGSIGSPTLLQTYRYVAIGLNAEYDTLASYSERLVTAAGTVTVAADDADIILINKTVGAATAVTLPLSASRHKPVKIVDDKGDANTNNITISPQIGESIYKVVNGTAIIDGNGGSVILTPKSDGTGWH